MPTVKCMLNSVVSTEGAKFMTIDTSDFYLNTPMEHYKYNERHPRLHNDRIRA
jgi:hypothetical protein